MKRIVMLLVIALFISACTTGNVVREDTIQFGADLFFTGTELSALAYSIQDGIDLAVEEINNEGGILGKKVQVQYEDNQFDIQQAVSTAQKLTSVNNVDLGFTAVVNTAKASGVIYEQAETPLVIVWDANEELEGIGDYVVSTGFSTEEAGYLMADFFHEKGITTAANIYHQDEWSELISKSFRERFVEKGGIILVEEQVSVETKDFKTELTKSLNTEGLFIPLVTNWNIAMKQAKELGYKGTVATGDGFSEDVIHAAPAATEGVYFLQPDGPEGKRKVLQEKYVAKYGKESEFPIFVAMGYDGVYIAKEAIERAGSTDGEKVKDALYTIKDFEGFTGKTTITETGNSLKKEKVYVVKEGAPVIVN